VGGDSEIYNGGKKRYLSLHFLEKGKENKGPPSEKAKFKLGRKREGGKKGPFILKKNKEKRTPSCIWKVQLEEARGGREKSKLLHLAAKREKKELCIANP